MKPKLSSRVPHRRRLPVPRRLALFAAAALLLAACGGDDGADDAAGDEGDATADDSDVSDDADDWPSRNMSLIVPSTPGGGVDTTSRQMELYLEDILGVAVSTANRGGGNFSVGPTSLLASNGADECNDIMMHAPPILQASYLTQVADYDLDDFYPISGITIEPGVIRVRDDSPWETLEDLVNDALDRPGEISASISGPTDANYFGILDIQEATGAEFNIIPYDGGGPARNAVLAGEADFTHAGMFNSLNIDEGTRVIAVHQPENIWPEHLTYNAPTVNDALGTDLPDVQTTYGLYVTRACYEDYPDRHQFLVDAVRDVQENPEYVANLESVGEEEKIRNVPPDEYHAEDLEIEERMIETLRELGELVADR